MVFPRLLVGHLSIPCIVIVCLACKVTFSMTRCDEVHRIDILGIHNDDNRRQCCRAMSLSSMVHIQSTSLDLLQGCERHLDKSLHIFFLFGKNMHFSHFGGYGDIHPRSDRERVQFYNVW